MNDPHRVLRLGIDLLGADSSPEDLLDAVIDLIEKENKPFSFRLFLTKEIFSLFEKKCPPALKIFFSCQQVTEIIQMDDEPLTAIKQKKNSSLYRGIEALQNQEIDAFVTAGNTGALTAASMLLLPKLPGISRLALLALMPTKKHSLAVIDVGATISHKIDHFVQYALLGAAFQQARGKKHPRVGLLNIGAEETKGTSFLKQTYQQLQKLAGSGSFSFYGNIEAKQAFEGIVDVLVTDGFTGNVLLKTSEGIASFILDTLQENLPSVQFEHIQSLLHGLGKQLHYAEYPGAALLGTEKIIIKCHGYSSPKAFQKGIKGALALYQAQLIPSIKKNLLSLSHAE